MKLLKTDRLIPVITISLIIVFSFMLYVDFSKKYTRSKAGEIGILTYKKRITERRFNEEVLWEDIEQNSKVFNCDYLRTTENSSAVVHLKDKTRIEIDENTLVLVCYSEQGVQINLDRGSIAARRTAGDRAMKITSGNASIDVKKGVISVNKSKEGVNLSISSGKADITVGGKKDVVDSGKTAVVTGNTLRIDRAAVRQVFPDINQYFVTAGKEYAVTFTWEPEGPQQVILQVAKDNAFTAVAGKAGSAGKNAVLTLPGGSYFWRLIDGQGKAGPARKFTIVVDRPAVPVSPYGGQQFSYKEKNPLVVFKWKQAGIASSYSVDISRDPAFKELVASLASDNDSIVTDALSAGTYYWRVRSSYGFNFDAALLSQPQQFSITPGRDLTAPEQLLPIEGDTASDLSISSGKTLFNWQGERDFTSYDFSIARDKESRNVVYHKKIDINFHKPKIALERGTYYWSISGITTAGSSSPRSMPRAFSVVKAQPPGLIGPESGAAVNSSALKVMNFRWSGLDGWLRYRFELSRDRDFRKMIRADTVSGFSHAIPTPVPGDYYWRVKLLDDGGVIVSASEIRRLSISEELGAPTGLYPVNNEAVTIDNRNGVVFKWKAVEGATHYQFRLKHVAGGREQILLTARADTNRYNLKKIELLDVGAFIWEISAVRQKGGTMAAQSQYEKNYFSIRLGKQLKAPKLKSDVIYVE